MNDPVSLGICGVVLTALVGTPAVITFLTRGGRGGPALRDDLWKRYKSWLVLAPLMIVPVILGRVPTILAVALLSLLCHREFARATGLFREKLTSILVVLGIVALTFASLDHWLRMYLAVLPLAVGVLAAANVFPDRPQGYVQRVALGSLSLALFGSGLGYLGMFANDARYQGILLWLIFTVQMNDIFAYISGKALGRRRLAPQTSPGKTVAGAVGALVLTTALAGWLATVVFQGTILATPLHAMAMGLLISFLGQLGDLVLSSIKRDIGIKDMGTSFPGHGGLLDRFDSLILAAPAIFHYINYFLGVGAGRPIHLLTGGG